MKVVRLFLLLLLLSCSEEESDVPVVKAEAPEAAFLEYPFANSRCIEGSVGSGDKTEIEFLWKPGNFSTSFDLVVVNLLTKAESKYSTSGDSYVVSLLRGTPYSWQIISYNSDHPEGTAGQPSKFYTSGDGITNYAPFEADLLQPAYGAEFAHNTEKVRLEWAAEDVDAEELKYELYISQDKDFSEASKHELSGMYYEVVVVPEMTYFWKVKTKDPVGNTSESNVSKFHILKEEEKGEDTSGKSSEKQILSFNINHKGVKFEGKIDHTAKTILLELDNFDYRDLVPTIEISEKAAVIPGSGKSQNFLDDLYYTVKAEDGTEVIYDIIVLSGQHDILDFEVHHEGSRYIGKVDNENATVTLELGGNDFSAMQTFIRTSNRSEIDPPAAQLQNFNGDLVYTVTSERGTTKKFKVMAPIKLKQNFPFYGGGGYEFTEENRDKRFVMFAGADLNFMAVNFPDPNDVKLELISTSGTAYPLEITEHAYYHQVYLELSETAHQFKTIIPYSVPSGTYTYRIRDGIKETSYPHQIEIINDDTTIKINSLNAEEFGYGDSMVVTGENLPLTFMIFADFSYFMFGEYNNNISLSEDQTQMVLEIDQNTYGNLSRGNQIKPIVFFTYIEGYEWPLLSNTAYFTLKYGW